MCFQVGRIRVLDVWSFMLVSNAILVFNVLNVARLTCGSHQRMI